MSEKERESPAVDQVYPEYNLVGLKYHTHTQHKGRKGEPPNSNVIPLS